MYPVLFKLGPIELHAYGALLALSFFLGILLASRRAPARGVAPEVVVDVSFAIVLAAVVGARLLYVLFHREEMGGLLDIVAVWKGGMTMYGGVLAAMGVSWLVARRKGVGFLNLADIMAPSLALGLMVTRVGCFLNGCCYGRPTDSFLGVTFPFQNAAGSSFGSPLHPTQLYSSLTGLLIFLFLLWFDRHPRPRGQLFGLYLILAGTGRFLVDLFRFYEANAYVLGSLTLSQVISLGLFAVGLLLLLGTRHSDPVTVPPEDPAGTHKVTAEHTLT